MNVRRSILVPAAALVLACSHAGGGMPGPG